MAKRQHICVGSEHFFFKLWKWLLNPNKSLNRDCLRQIFLKCLFCYQDISMCHTMGMNRLTFDHFLVALDTKLTYQRTVLFKARVKWKITSIGHFIMLSSCHRIFAGGLVYRYSVNAILSYNIWPFLEMLTGQSPTKISTLPNILPLLFSWTVIIVGQVYNVWHFYNAVLRSACLFVCLFWIRNRIRFSNV